MSATLIDSHAHLDASQFDEDREEVIQRAFEAGVGAIVNIGATDGLEGAQRSTVLADRYPQIWLSVGVHPHDAGEEHDFDKLKSLAQHAKVVAIGETGLDFYRDWAPRDRQYEYFRQQVELALELQKPLVIHSRAAGAECYKVLQEMKAEQVGGVFHCYAEDADFAKKLRDLNFMVSFPGTLTFKKAEDLRKAAQEIPLDQIMVETDAPFLAPDPFRGKRCESAHVVHTARKLAEVKELSFEEIAEVTTENAKRFYRIELS